MQEFSQIPVVDCGSTFAPVSRLHSIHRMLATAAELDYEVHMLDARTAFLHANVEEDVFDNTALGYDTNDKAGVPLVIKLKKYLYGLLQSPKNWFGTIDVELAVIGFRPLKSGPCVYIHENETGVVILTIYVDGIPFLSASETLTNKLKKQLMDRFEMSDMGDVSRLLGFSIPREPEKRAITISQTDYTKKVIQRYDMESCNPAYTPGVGPEQFLHQLEEKLPNEKEKRRYQGSTGAVMYLAQVTRYDILYVVNQLARTMSKPAKTHIGAAKCLVRYLTGFTDLFITYY